MKDGLGTPGVAGMGLGTQRPVDRLKFAATSGSILPQCLSQVDRLQVVQPVQVGGKTNSFPIDRKIPQRYSRERMPVIKVQAKGVATAGTVGTFINDSTQPLLGQPAGSCCSTLAFNWPKKIMPACALQKISMSTTRASRAVTGYRCDAAVNVIDLV